MMRITPRIQKLITEKATSQDIRREALNDGMLSLREYAIKKMARGETTYEEVVAMTDELRIY
jgi:type IV pilus assembly protein PilB